MIRRILFVLSSHDRKGPFDAADAVPSGFYLSEVTHPHAALRRATEVTPAPAMVDIPA